jgi:D-cysteine desulfhydrase
MMDISRFPRRIYTEYKTPVEKLFNFSEALNGPTVFIKRDDLLGLTSGGNKTRKLEFLVADALKQGADTLVTCGAIQSNHCRLTLAAAVKEGLKCRLVLEERVPGSYNPEASGNNFLFHLLGVESIAVVKEGTDMEQAMNDVAQDLSKQGRRPYIIPGGGSNPIGATGYVACAMELEEQIREQNLTIDAVVVASGSTGTHAGLVAGFWGAGLDIPIYGINVSRDKEVQEKLVHSLVERTASHVGIKTAIPKDKVVCFGDYWRPKYSVPNIQMIEAVNLLAKTEGILLDPTYTGKAMAGLIDLSRNGFFKPEDRVLYIHTGGSPALYAYMDCILGKEKVTASSFEKS